MNTVTIRHNKIRWDLITIWIAAIFLSASSVEEADGQIWTNPSGGSFNNPANWNTFAIPGAGQDTEFSLSNNYGVSFNTNVTNRSAAVTNGGVTFQTSPGQPIRTYELTQSLSVNDGGSLTIGGPTESSRLNIVAPLVDIDGDGNLNLRSGSSIDSTTVRVGAGTVSISDQSSVLANGGVSFIGSATDEAGRVVVSGAGSSWNSATTMVGSGGDGTLVVTGGATATIEHSRVGWLIDSVGAVQVIGDGSELDVAFDFWVGASGNGTLNVRNGGSVTSGDASIAFAAGSGAATVFGEGSVWDVENTLTVGRGFEGQGALNIEAGGRVESEFGTLGANSGSNGNALVTGTDSRWDVVDEIYVGLNGTGELTVEDGAVVSDVIGFLGFEAGSDGTATVRGSGSMWNNSNALIVGRAGSGRLNIESGGSVTAIDTTVGQLEGSNGQISVEGTGSVLNSSGVLTVGDGDRGSVSIREGGTVSAQTVRLGDAADMTSSISLVGEGSNLTVAESLRIGGAGRGTIFMAGGLISADNIRVGDFSIGTGALNVGPDSNVEAADSLWIGNQGRLFLLGGTVSAGQNTVLDESGVIQIDRGRLEFGSMDFHEYLEIDANIGSMAGEIELTGFTDAGSGLAPSSEFDFFDVNFNNTGTIIGTGFMNGSLNNQTNGQVQLLANDQIRFAGNGQNSGEVNNFGGFTGFQGTFTNASDGLVAGRGVFSAEQGWINEGVFAFSSGNADLLGDVELTGGSRVVTSGSGTTTFYDDLIHNGIEIRTSVGSETVIFGDASGAGSYTGAGTVFFEGDLRPGNSPDSVTFDGDVVFGETSGLLIELGGTEAGFFDQLLIAGDLELRAELSVEMLDDFMVGQGQEFLIADVGGQLLGQFDGLDEGALVGNYGADLFITYQAGSGNSIALFSAIPEPNAFLLLAFLAVIGGTVRNRMTTI